MEAVSAAARQTPPCTPLPDCLAITSSPLDHHHCLFATTGRQHVVSLRGCVVVRMCSCLAIVFIGPAHHVSLRQDLRGADAVPRFM